MVQVSSNASALESPTIAVISSIVDNLTESAIEDTQVIVCYTNHCIIIIHFNRGVTFRFVRHF